MNRKRPYNLYFQKWSPWASRPPKPALSQWDKQAKSSGCWKGLCPLSTGPCSDPALGVCCSFFCSGVYSHIVRIPAGSLPKLVQTRASCVWRIKHSIGAGYRVLGELDSAPLCGVNAMLSLNKKGKARETRCPSPGCTAADLALCVCFPCCLCPVVPCPGTSVPCAEE